MGGSWTATSMVEIYDPATDTVEEGISMPTARGDFASATVNGTIYAIGGHTGVTWDAPGTIYGTVEAFALPVTTERKLTIQKSVLLSWKQSPTDYIVESASSPEGPWTELTQFESRIVGDEVHATVIQAGAAQFFRLSVTP
jgi:hypothetical protein